MSDAPYEFVCRDCGEYVVSWGTIAANQQDICVTCSWLRAIEDPVARAAARRFVERADDRLKAPRVPLRLVNGSANDPPDRVEEFLRGPRKPDLPEGSG